MATENRVPICIAHLIKKTYRKTAIQTTVRIIGMTAAAFLFTAPIPTAPFRPPKGSSLALGRSWLL